MKKFFYIKIAVLLLCVCSVYGQQQESVLKEFSVKVKVVNDKTNESIKDARVDVNGISYRYSFVKDSYLVKATVNSTLEVSHPDFISIPKPINRPPATAQ